MMDFEDTFEHHMTELTMFNEAYNHKDPEQHTKKQHATIRKEFKDMNNHGVWCKVRQSTIPKGQCCIKSKWVCKIKWDGVFQARLVACRYRQIPSVNFTIDYAPIDE